MMRQGSPVSASRTEGDENAIAFEHAIDLGLVSHAVEFALSLLGDHECDRQPVLKLVDYRSAECDRPPSTRHSN
jgi:hypothetical protein